MSLPFDLEEFTARLQRVREAMGARGIDMLLLSDPCNIYYLTGYDGWSFYTPQLLAVPLDRDPVWLGRAMDVAGVCLTSALRNGQVFGYADTLVQSADGHPVDAICDGLKARGLAKGVIGIEADSYYLTANAHARLVAGLQNARITDASLLVNWVRFVKSPAEQDMLREAGTLLTASMRSGIAACREGVRESEVAADVYSAQLRGTEHVGGAYTSSPAFIVAGERIASPHLPWTDRALARGDQVNLELMGNRRRYQVTMGRTVVIGTPAPKLKELEAIIQEVIAVVLEHIRPGITCGSVADTMRIILKRYGIDKDSRCGYSLGIAYPPTGGELTASLRSSDTTIIPEGAALHFLPAIWMESASIMMSEPILVTESGAECLCDVDRRVHVS
jgi:ectoine hydrolase